MEKRAHEKFVLLLLVLTACSSPFWVGEDKGRTIIVNNNLTSEQWRQPCPGRGMNAEERLRIRISWMKELDALQRHRLRIHGPRAAACCAGVPGVVAGFLGYRLSHPPVSWSVMGVIVAAGAVIVLRSLPTIRDWVRYRKRLGYLQSLLSLESVRSDRQ